MKPRRIKFDKRPLEGPAEILNPGPGTLLPFDSGIVPFKGGPYASMYVSQPWTIRQYAGFSTAEESNAFYKNNLAAGQMALSVAFDLATHRGYDSDHERVRGDVGKAGVAIDTVEDMKILFRDIPLDKMSVSMTMNGAVIPILAFYIVTAEEQGVKPAQLTGTIQNDILKEFLVRNTYIYPPVASMRLVTDIFNYSMEHMPRFNSISVSGYHMLEAGAPAHLELAFTLADGFEYLNYGIKAGLNIDEFAPRISYFFGIGMDFYLEIAKLRAARMLWAELVIKAGGKSPKSQMLRTHCQTSGWSLTRQDAYNNIARTSLEALAGVWGGTQSLHTNSLDEAMSLPTPETAAIARETQLFLQKNAGLTDWIDPMGGVVYLNTLTDELISKSRIIMDEIFKLGGMTKAIQQGYPKKLIEEASILKQARIDSGEDKLIGINFFTPEKEEKIPVLKVDNDAVLETQLSRLKQVKNARNPTRVKMALKKISQSCKSDSSNILEAAIHAARERATLGEISAAIEQVFGRYQAPVSGLSKIYSSHSMKNKFFNKATQAVLAFERRFGRRPRILVAKLGQDGHDRGAKIIATGFADIGFDVDIGPLFQTPAEAARHAVENDVHFIGVSSLSGGHQLLVPELIEQLKKAGRLDIAVVVGGIIPETDRQTLFRQGVLAVFGPGTNLAEAAYQLMKLMIT